MEALIALVIAVLVGCGVYLLLRARTFPVILGLTLLSYAVNLFIFVMGRLANNASSVIGQGDRYVDPLPQALVLTAIVIGFGVLAFMMVLAYRTSQLETTDDLDDTRSTDALVGAEKSDLVEVYDEEEESHPGEEGEMAEAASMKESA